MPPWRPSLLVPLAALLVACTVDPLAAPGVPVLRPEVLAELPHDPAAFTEGFEIAGNSLYEGTGLAGSSQLRELDPATGAVRRAVALPGDLFGEGVTVVGDRIWQLTWRDGVALEWDRASLTLLREVPFAGEGWGLCHTGGPGGGGALVRSDGTDVLHVHDPVTFAETGSVHVTLDGRPLADLNELECVGGLVLANVWKTERIAVIDPADGRVTAVVDASGVLRPDQRAGTDVMNGIAAEPGPADAGPGSPALAGRTAPSGPDGATIPGTFLLTGKYWPVTFRVRFGP